MAALLRPCCRRRAASVVSAAAAFLVADVASNVAVADGDTATAPSSLPTFPSWRAPARYPSRRRFHRRRRQVARAVVFGRRRRRKFAAVTGIILPFEFQAPPGALGGACRRRAMDLHHRFRCDRHRPRERWVFLVPVILPKF